MTTLIEQRIALPAVRSNDATWSGAAMAFLIFYTVAFPKGGIKVGGVPLTIGYVLTVLLLLVAMMRAHRVSLPLDRLLAFAPCLLLGLWSAFVVSTNGTDATGFTIAYFISAVYLPIFGLTVFSSLTLDDYGGKIERALIWAVRLIVLYGIFLFFFKQLTGRWIEIPYLTVNADDLGQLDDKYINRGGIFKLISTYNNGNIFGVSLAIVAPLYLRIEPKRWLKWAMYAALFLTLSRTAWIAAILVMSLNTLSNGMRPASVLYIVVALLTAGLVILGLLDFLGRDMSFLLDANLGGRAGQLDVLNDVRVVPEGAVSALPEIAYLGMIRYFGIPGLLLFTAHLLAPSVLLYLEGVRVFSPTRGAACMQGLLTYTVIAGADAAYSFIPVMMVFWMVAGLGLWYAHHQGRWPTSARETPR